jgi:hypothetical protein
MIPSLIYADRYRNEGTRTYSKHADYTEAQEKYRPNSRHPRFYLAVFEVPRDQMYIYTANPSIELATTYLATEKVLFCIHPQMLEEHQDDPYVKQTLSIGTLQNGITVSASSSTRTLYVLDDEVPHAIKVHFPFRISRYDRKMRDEVLEQAINISLENIMFPIIRHWVECFLNFGYLLEPHGQNVLFEIGKDGEIERIVHRDLALGIDMRRRREIHLPDSNLNEYNRMESNEFHSITYDKFMGGHFFDRIVASCQEKYPDLKKEDFRKPCRDEFTRLFPDYAKYLPKTIRYFSEDRDQFGKPFYQDTGKAPVWRP